MPKQTGSWIKKQSKGSDTYSTQKSITVANIFHSDRQKKNGEKHKPTNHVKYYWISLRFQRGENEVKNK